ncbi:hypothetical protein KBY58_04895 [Cyanobium sp. HWJ4-Hawea]|nr:hypothetical protein [Cyanobium sp. HWJ4-Hawea]
MPNSKPPNCTEGLGWLGGHDFSSMPLGDGQQAKDNQETQANQAAIWIDRSSGPEHTAHQTELSQNRVNPTIKMAAQVETQINKESIGSVAEHA